MPKEWENYSCQFNTDNTENKEGDSTYRVGKTQLERHAPINNVRPGEVVDHPKQTKAVAYLDPNNKNLFQAIMAQGDDSEITIVAVNGDAITVKVSGLPGGDVVGICDRRPQEGFYVFDAVNNGGQLSSIHVGHKVKHLQNL